MAAPPTLDGRGKNQVNRARRPDEVEVVHPIVGPMLVRAPGEDRPSKGSGVQGEQVDRSTGEITERRRGRKVRITEKRRLVGTQKALLWLRDGWLLTDVANELNVSVATVTGWIARHRRTVEAADIDSRLDEIAVPLAVDNLVHGLLVGDKDYTLETLKGRGKLRRHTAGEEVVKHELPTLVVRYEGAPVTLLAEDPTTAGHVVGAMRLPAKDEGDVVDAEVIASEGERAVHDGSTQGPPKSESR